VCAQSRRGTRISVYERGWERTGSAFRSEFLRELIFAAAAAGDGFVRGEKEEKGVSLRRARKDRANNERDVEDKWGGFIPRTNA